MNLLLHTTMPKLQIDIPEKLNKILKIKKAERGCKNLQTTLILFLNEKLDSWKLEKKDE